ncbi:MAG: crotonase/enoyl-CoA hydratase family protein [Acidimicrobiales bacterium]|nr:crotonase/enoyl-CoA hydratase family protein [Acidimicrobiales bacterium]
MKRSGLSPDPSSRANSVNISAEGRITTEVRGRILLMGIDRPAKMNGFTPEMMDGLVEAFTRLDDDADLWCGVLFGHGDHFTAGLDLPRWHERMRSGERRRGTGAVDPTALGRKCTKPIVTAVQGVTYTLGIELMLAGDIVVAADDCRFSQLEPLRGIHAAGGATIRFVQRGGWGNAMYHLLTSDVFDSAEALRIGLVQEVVPAGTQLDRAMELATVICEGAPLAVQATKASSMRFVEEGEAAAVAALGPKQAELAATDDAAEGVASFVERRKGHFKGC